MMRAVRIQSGSRWLSIVTDAMAPGDAQGVGEHLRGMLREPHRGVLVVHEPQRLAAHPIARGHGPPQYLDVEGEAADLERLEERARDARLVALVSALGVGEAEADQMMDHPGERRTRELPHRRHVRGAFRFGQQAVADHDVRVRLEPGEGGRNRIEAEREVGVGEQDRFAARAQHARRDRAALALILPERDQRRSGRKLGGRGDLLLPAAVIDDEQLRRAPEPVAQEPRRLLRRLHRPRALVVGGDHHRERQRDGGDSFCARSARLSTLYIGVSGSSGRSVSPSGRLKLASSSPTNARSAARSGGAAGSRATTKAHPTSPNTGSGTPTTAAFATPGCAASRSSTSLGYTLNPPRMYISLCRPRKRRYPAGSRIPTSPVCIHPSASMRAAVCSGSRQYPRIVAAERTTTSPTSPGGSARPASSTMRSSTPGVALPTVVARTSGGSPSSDAVAIPTSVDE